ncbi:MAG: Uncharacterised protein [Flavobacteriales bacterium UBA4585]|nr:MAG: Uncharacterised protein [Flavobacteriales bacterium UBA4585]
MILVVHNTLGFEPVLVSSSSCGVEQAPKTNANTRKTGVKRILFKLILNNKGKAQGGHLKNQ